MFYFSIFSGQIYEASDDEILDAMQIPLIKKPSPSCKKCYGRFYTDYNLSFKQYTMCPKCLKQCLHGEKLLELFKNRKNPPMDKVTFNVKPKDEPVPADN